VRQAIVPAGGLSGRRFRYATNFRVSPGCLLESLALPIHPICDAAASQRIEEGVGDLYFGEVFIPFSWAEGLCQAGFIPPFKAHEKPNSSGVPKPAPPPAAI
jgi:hypothetical protein